MGCFDEEEMWQEEGCFESISWEGLWTFLSILTFVLAIASVCWLGYTTHVSNNQEREIQKIEDPYRDFDSVIRANVEEDYFIHAYTKVDGHRMKDHTHRGILLPKTGPIYESAFCSHIVNSPKATMRVTRQFMLDLRNLSKHEKLVTYDSIEIVFEIPWGEKLSGYQKHNDILSGDQKHPQIQTPGANGDIQYIYDPISGTLIVDPNSIPSDGGENLVEQGKHTKSRCPFPLCPSINTLTNEANCFSPQSPYKEPYSNVGFEFSPITNTLRELVVKEVSTPIHCGAESNTVAAYLKCSCSNEKPPRFSCKFPLDGLVGKLAYYRLDLGFEYPVTITKNHH